MTKLIQIIFKEIPQKYRGVIAIVLLFCIVVGGFFYFFPTKSNSENECKTISISGKIINRITNEVIEAKEISLESSTLTPDLTINNGVFTIVGVKLPPNKIVAFQIKLSNNKIYSTQDFNLGNKDKFPVEDCLIDIGIVPVEINQLNLPKNKIHSVGNHKLLEKTFTVTNSVNENFIESLEKRVRLKYCVNNADYKITFGYTGQIISVNEDKTLFVYHGGNLLIKVNGKNCKVLNDIILDRTFSSGNDYSFVEKENDNQIYNYLNSTQNIFNEIASCLKN